MAAKTDWTEQHRTLYNFIHIAILSLDSRRTLGETSSRLDEA